ncbi:MAG: hypothetical protein KDC84_02300 [Crocinitomicaceae bacterium]|nr:hypothetical protein [Crocinitomicaceae bacterium]
MPNIQTENLIQLIGSLSKAEKRAFKLYVGRFQSSDNAKFLQIFDFIDKTRNYSDSALLKKYQDIKKSQLSNLKAHLYKQLLVSLRLQHAGSSTDIDIRESIDYARVLYNRGLYNQSLRILERAKSTAKKYNLDILSLDITFFEKKIESQYITRSIDSRAEELALESNQLIDKISESNEYSNLTLKLYGLYLKVGFVKNEKEYLFVKQYFDSNFPDFGDTELDYYEKMHLYNAYYWYYYIVQDFLNCYKYAKKWVDLYEEYPEMKEYEFEIYLKGINNILGALFNLRHYEKFVVYLDILKDLLKDPVKRNENTEYQLRLYYYTNLINKHFLEGTFSDGLRNIPEIEEFLEEYETTMDYHRSINLNYKIACLFFGAGDNRNTIIYLNKIINVKESSLREDIQCFARILNLIAHYEVGNEELVEYQIKSVYRFLSKMDDLQGVQEEILSWVRNLRTMRPEELDKSFKILRSKLVKLSQMQYEKRPFLYLDIISWLESKIIGTQVQSVVQEKFKREQLLGESLYFPVKKS